MEDSVGALVILGTQGLVLQGLTELVDRLRD